MKIIGYARVSTKNQSYQPQVEAIQKFAKNNDHELIEIIKEKMSGISNRPGLDRLMEMATNKKFGGVVVTKLNRFGRSVTDLLVSIEKLRRLGIEFISLGENIDTSTPTGRLLFHFLAIISEFEREMIVEQLREGKKRAIARGTLCTRPKLDLPDDEIVKYFVEHKLSIGAIAKIYQVSKGTIFNRLRAKGVDTSRQCNIKK